MFQHVGLSENRVYSQWNSHLIGIMISKTIGFRGTNHFQTNPCCLCDFHESSEVAIFHMLRAAATKLRHCLNLGKNQTRDRIRRIIRGPWGYEEYHDDTLAWLNRRYAPNIEWSWNIMNNQCSKVNNLWLPCKQPNLCFQGRNVDMFLRSSIIFTVRCIV